VHDVADVRLVDAEAEGDRRHHDDALALLHEARLVLDALLVGHLAVVARARDLDRRSASQMSSTVLVVEQ
jgi:hypothetical protein